ATALTEWGAYNSPQMLAASERALDDPDSQVRSSAAANFAGVRSDRRAKVLAPLLEDPDFLVRRTVARTLADAMEELPGKAQNLLRLNLLAWTDGIMTSNDRGGAHLAVGSLYE